MQQTKIENFFSVTTKNTDKNKKCFIYDPDNYKAFFENNIDINNDIFLTIKCGIKLYYRVPKTSKAILLPKIQTKANIPLLKSNLQKAIRRCQTQIAINSALAIIQEDPIEFLRRLPIIYIEDVCLMDSYSIPVWLMMAEKEHKLDLIDIDILLNIVKNLCECNIYYDDSLEYIVESFKLSHNNLKDFEHKDLLLSIFYRSQYGGMKCDMRMLKNSLYYYLDRPSKILETVYNSIDYTNFNPNLEILPEAIDFHPFPQMINMIVKQTNLDNNDIRLHIWYCESGVNIRKPLTMDKSREYSDMKLWKIIKPRLARVRCILMQ